jgi:hypothetical protein
MRNRSRHTRRVGTLRERVSVSACGCVSVSARGRVGALARAWVFGAWRGHVGARWRVGVGTLPCERMGVWPCRCVGCGIDVCGHIESLMCWHVGALASGCLAYLHCVLARGAWCMGTWAAVKFFCCSQQASCSDGVVERVTVPLLYWMLCSGYVVAV